MMLGRALPTKDLIHQRLGKSTALAVFSSDALSSVAYATEEMLRVLIPAAGLAAFALIMPISIVIAVILATLVFSYRQTIKAYPSAGGAYIVTKDNFGVLPAQVAGVALLTDYVLTVAVSVSAGVAAIVAVAPGIYPFRVPLALFFVALLAWGNLRGVKESGRLFASPTYMFLVGILVLVGLGIFRLATGAIHPLPVPANLPSSPADVGLLSGVGLYVVLHALASGSTAMTGVEAISNGVPAFKPPEWKNARTTLMIMGGLLGTMFLGISFLAHSLHVMPDLTDRQTVVAMIARQVFGAGPFGHAAFLFLQVTTMAILVLAANTSFADFPRLASFQAGDSFMPRQLTKRGHRLVFSNGIIGLAIAAGVLIVGFNANVTRLIPFYALGVFTSFTLSQAGMARRHLRLRESGWRRGLLINGWGAVATGALAVIIAVTKFTQGAWVVLVVVPILVVMLVRMNRRYENESEDLTSGLEGLDPSATHRPLALVFVEELDHKTLHAIQYVKTIRPQEAQAVHFERDLGNSTDLVARWKELEMDIPLKVVKATSDIPSCLAGYVGALPNDLDVTVVIPGPARMGVLERLRRGRTGAQLTKALLPYHRARITLVRDHSHEAGHEVHGATDLPEHHRPRLIHKVVVLVDKVDKASLQAVEYAVSLGAAETWGVHAAIDQENQEDVISRWLDLFSPVPLQVIECWDRNIARSIESYVAEMAGPDDEITVVVPRRDYSQVRQRALHDRTSRSIARSLSRYAHVDMTVVPYYFDRAATRTPSVR
jgi:amino acid transporter